MKITRKKKETAGKIENNEIIRNMFSGKKTCFEMRYLTACFFGVWHLAAHKNEACSAINIQQVDAKSLIGFHAFAAICQLINVYLSTRARRDAFACMCWM